MIFRIIAAVLLGSLLIQADNLAVVVGENTPIDTLDRNQIRSIFLKKRTFFNGIAVKPINLAPSNPFRKAFAAKILQMDEKSLERYWIREHYRGHRPPYRVESVRAMIRFVLNVPGAIGYLPQNKVTKKMKVLYWITL